MAMIRSFLELICNFAERTLPDIERVFFRDYHYSNRCTQRFVKDLLGTMISRKFGLEIL